MLSTEDPQPSLIAKADSRRIAIYRAGEYAPLVTQNAPEDRRLFLHPLRTSDGAAVLTEDAPPHHLWQHGLKLHVHHLGYGANAAKVVSATPTDSGPAEQATAASANASSVIAVSLRISRHRTAFEFHYWCVVSAAPA